MSRLPRPGSDSDIWGLILNDFLMREHNADGSLKVRSDGTLDNLPNDATVLHKDRDETVAGALTFPQQDARTGQVVMHSVNNPSGFVQKNIVFRDEGELSRGGPVWVDHNGRVQTWLGWHDKIPSGSAHHGLEVKTAADPNGANPDVLVTRFRLKSDADQTQAAFYSTEMVYIENGIHSPDTQFGITFNTPQSGSVAAGTSSGTYKLGKVTVNVDSSGVATMDLGVGLDDTTGAKLRIFRESNVPSASLALYKADGTDSQTFYVDAKTGGVTLAGRQQFKNLSDVVMYNVTPIIDGSGHTIVDNDPIVQDTGKNATIRLFRNTNTTQTRSFRILRGDGTNTDSFVVNAGSGDVSVTGNLTVDGSITASNFFDEFELRRSSSVSTMSRMLATTNSLTLNAGTVYGVLAFAKTAGTFTKIRFATGGSSGGSISNATEMRLGVYNASNILLSETTNISGTVTATATMYDNIALTTPVVATAGQQFYLAFAYTGTGSISGRGSSILSAMAGLTPAIAKTTSYPGGTLPTLGSAATGNVLWMELVP